MKKPLIKKSKLVLTSLSLLLITGFQTARAEHQNYIVNCNADCAPLIEKVSSLGGTVTNKYQNINAISISMDSENRAQLIEFSPNAELTKDKLVSLPNPKDQVMVSENNNPQIFEGAALQKFIEEDMPEGFEFNNLLTGATLMNSAGFTGANTVVAVIDSGSANVSALSGSIIGGENFVPGADEPSATSSLNVGHGTNTATMIAGHGLFGFTTAGSFAQSVATHMPESIFIDFVPGVSAIPMFGSAPDAKIYAMKVFAAAGGGAPESRIIAAMDRVITLRKNYNDGMSTAAINPGCGAEEDPCVFNAVNISVVNMSLGGGTLYAARDLEDSLTTKMLEVGITLVASAGNEGFSAITGGSPGTGLGSLTVGAASTVGNERVLRDLQNGLGVGAFYRPSNHHQMATFSSRGPSTDGRISIDVVANGFACLMQNANGGITLSSGTSFSAPMVAGAAATLVGAFPDASAIEIRNAIIQGANPNLLGDGSGPIDQGAGFINVPNSFGLLATNSVDTRLPEGKGNKKVSKNLKEVGIKVIKPHHKHPKTFKAKNLKPGQVAHYFIESKKDTDKLTIKIEDIVASLPAEEQNLFFGDDIYYNLQDAITHTDAVIAGGFITADEEIVIDNPQTGILRLAVMGDWTNAGDVSAKISVMGHKSHQAKKAAKGKVDQNETQVETFFIPDGTTQATFELSWKNNWSAYPTDDIDFILLDPAFNALFDGASFSSPERVVIDSPAAGSWTVLVQGFTVHNVNKHDGSKWELRLTDQDGKSIKQDDDDDDDEDEDD
jgi:hypothetical protein